MELYYRAFRSLLQLQQEIPNLVDELVEVDLHVHVRRSRPDPRTAEFHGGLPQEVQRVRVAADLGRERIVDLDETGYKRLG